MLLSEEKSAQQKMSELRYLLHDKQ